MYMAYENVKTACLYLRYSDRAQSEQSIEGQMRVCKEFCGRNGITILETYIDRATSARSVEKRFEFKRMMKDSEKHMWDSVVVYKLDRFARNRYDSATYKSRLKKNDVKVISATENLSDNPESIILEAVLEGMAEFYSAELSQKITRGRQETALKCNSLGGVIPLGYKVENKKYVIDPLTAPIVQEAFDRYASGETVADICRHFNLMGYRTAKGAAFNRNSFKTLFHNERYIGVYMYKDMRVEGGMPAIIDRDLFEKVQQKLTDTAAAPGRATAKVDYLLSGKLFCGHCGDHMTGETGTGAKGVKYNYYTCHSRKRHRVCDKKPLRKEYIEKIVAQDAMSLLTDDYIEELAEMAEAQSLADLEENTLVPELIAKRAELKQAINNITKAIEKGVASDTLLGRLTELEKERKDVEKQLTIEQSYVYIIERSIVIGWLNSFKNGDIEKPEFKTRLFDLLVNSVTVWDEPDGYTITTAYNLSSLKTRTFRIPKASANESSAVNLHGSPEKNPVRALAGIRRLSSAG